VSRVNLWIEQHHIDVLNVETVLVTSLPKEDEASSKVEMTSQANVSSTIQILRVWYRESVGVEAAYTEQTTRLNEVEAAYTGQTKRLNLERFDS
jgi:hypothetical protein